MDRAQIIEQRLRASSPLEVALSLKELELYDKKESQEVFDEVYKQFENGDNQVDNILKPVMLTVLDSLMESAKPLRELRKKGITASRVWTDCENFSYEKPLEVDSDPNAYQELKNIREEAHYDAGVTTIHGSQEKDRESVRKDTNDILGIGKEDSSYERKKYEDTKKMGKYKDVYFGDQVKAKDEYRDAIITKDESATDHIIPLARVHEQFSGNIALNKEDIRSMANQEGNYAITEQTFNSSKGDKLNEEMKTYHGQDISEIGADKNRMKELSERAQADINDAANKCVLLTLKGKGNVRLTDDDYKKINEEIEKKHGNNLTREEKSALRKEKAFELKESKQKEKAKEVYDKLGQNALSQSREYALGNIILFFIKPIAYEMKDIIKKGLKAGDKTKSKRKAIQERFNRVKEYVLNNAFVETLGIAKDFVKMFISSLIEGIINLFVGFYKMIFKIIKEGIKIFVKASKIIWGKKGKNMSEREKGDAILKLIGASIAGLVGIGVEHILSHLAFIPGWARMVLATLCSGLVSILFMYSLDKMDLFSVKSEKRRQAIETIFNARIKDVETATKKMDSTAIEILDAQYKAFDTMAESMKVAMKNNDFAVVSNNIKELSKFLQIELPYSSTEEFVKAYDNNPYLSLE